MDSGFDQNQTELAVDVLAITLQMLSNTDGALDQIIQIFWDVRFQADGFHDAENFVSVDEANLSNAMGVTKNDS